MTYLENLVVLWLFLNVAFGAKILGVFPSPGYSQFILAERLMMELVNRGHEVTVISPFSPTEKVKNYNEVRTAAILEVMKDSDSFDLIEHNDFINMYNVYTGLAVAMVEYTLAEPKVQALINSNASFDLVIVEQFWNEAHMGFAHHFKAPLVLFSSLGASEWTNDLVANPSPPSYICHTFAGYSNEMTALQRARNLVFYLYELFLRHVVMLPKQNELLHRYFPNMPDLSEIMYNASVILLNSHPSVTEPVPLVPNMIEVGGFHVVPENVPSDVTKFMYDAQNGVIYFSMGSNLRSKDIPEQIKKDILETFSKLQQKIVWKFEDESLLNIPDNVLIRKWLPQRGILGHSNVKLFISHCGLISTIEAVYFGVPLICIPIYGDQKMNAAVTLKNGVSVFLPYKQLNSNTLLDAINTILNNSSYTEEMKKRSGWMHDRPSNPMSTAMYWIEYVLKHGGAPHLRSAALHLQWYEYAYLDVLLYITLTLVVYNLLAALSKTVIPSTNQNTPRKKHNQKQKRH